MSDLEGTYEIGSRLRLFVDGELEEPFVATVEAEAAPAEPGHSYHVAARDDFGNEITEVVLERGELREFLAEQGVAP